MERHTYVFANGMRVVFLQSKVLPIVKMKGLIRAGPHLHANRWGAAFVPPMLTLGTKRHSREEFAELLDNFALHYSVQVSGLSEFFVKWDGAALRQWLPQLFELTEESLRSPSFPEKELAILQRKAVSSLREAADDPAIQAVAEGTRMLYAPKHPFFVSPIDESIERLASVSVADLEQSWNTLYTPNRMSMVVVGDIDSEAAKRQIENLFGSWGSAQQNEVPKERSFQDYVRTDTAVQERTLYFPQKASAIFWAGHCLSITVRDRQFAALSVALNVLGGGMHSRLFAQVRERAGLSYSIHAMFQDPNVIPGHFFVLAFTNPKSIDKLQREVLSVMRTFCEKGITSQELEEARQLYKGKQARLNSSYKGQGEKASMDMITGVPNYLDNLAYEITKLTVDEVNDAILQHIKPDELRIVRAGTIPA